MSFPLSASSALVLVCDKVSYQSPAAKKFLARLNLSSGRKMYQRLKHLKPWIDEIIPNRKFLIHQFVRKFLKGHKRLNSPYPPQVLVLACGWDPILIKMSEEFPRGRFFGLDSAPVGQVQKLAKQILPQSDIVYIQADIASPANLLIKTLKNKGCFLTQPTCLVVEGIMYYIRPAVFWQALKTLTQKLPKHSVICGDFLMNHTNAPYGKMSQKISSGIFNMIKTECSTPYYTYSPEQITRRLKQLKAREIKFFSHYELQKQRTNTLHPWTKNDTGHTLCWTARLSA